MCCMLYQFSKYQNPFSHEKKSFKIAQNYQKLPKHFEVETSLKPPEDFFLDYIFEKSLNFYMFIQETDYFSNENLKNRSQCIGLHHSLKSVSTALTTSSMRRKIRILLGNPVHAWRATECTWLRFHHITFIKKLLTILQLLV